MSVDESLEAVEARRAAKREARRKEYEAQRAIDLAALDALEDEHGASKIAVVDVPHSPGLPTLVVARLPKPAEVERYRSRVKDRAEKKGDPIKAAEELASVCLLYPARDVYDAIIAERHALHAQLGAAALTLSVGEAQEQGKG